MKIILIGIRRTFIFLLLTLVTQVGGFIYLLSILLAYRLGLKKVYSALLFLTLYFSATFLVVPYIAESLGRVSLPLYGSLSPLNMGTCLLNRHYVTPNLKTQLMQVSETIGKQYANSTINYLDANFPFFDGFPLLPHLSHSDGKKVDLAFFYKDDDKGIISNSAPSLIGYGIYESPLENEENTALTCSKKGFWQYGFLDYLVPTWGERNLTLDVERTKHLIRLLAIDPTTNKIFIEPHLNQRWQLTNYSKIRFHGCHAVRHDDHIHLQVN